MPPEPFNQRARSDVANRGIADHSRPQIRLYHWTRVAAVDDILRTGLRASRYESESGMALGVWFSEDPSQWSAGNTARVIVDFDEAELDRAWQSRLIHADWQIPESALAARSLVVDRSEEVGRCHPSPAVNSHEIRDTA
jgi:hypothetical protein